MRLRSVCTFSLALTCFVLSAQEKETTFSTDVKVVNVFATVRDKQGKIVSNLNKEDFVLSENGAEQPIRYFSREVDLPLTIGLLVDTSGSQRGVLGQEKTASYTFLDKILKPDRDQTFVIHFDFESELLQDLTSSRKALQNALDQLELPAGMRQFRRRLLADNWQFPGGGMGGRFPGGGGMGRGGRGGSRYPGAGGPRGGGGGGRGGTTLYDAVYLASDEILRHQTGRKAIILLTDGVDHGSKTSLSSAVESAQRADTLVYSILFTDENAAFGNRADGRRVLQKISQETGGNFFEASKKLTIDQIYERIQEELRSQYSIGYSPASGAASEFRAIKLTTKRQGMIVTAREGYYPAAH